MSSSTSISVNDSIRILSRYRYTEKQGDITSTAGVH
nr:MAG TPA: hypothetical protein [Caudoviricetes sp.]